VSACSNSSGCSYEVAMAIRSLVCIISATSIPCDVDEAASTM
jgi:hypothetical protein